MSGDDDSGYFRLQLLCRVRPSIDRGIESFSEIPSTHANAPLSEMGGDDQSAANRQFAAVGERGTG